MVKVKFSKKKFNENGPSPHHKTRIIKVSEKLEVIETTLTF